MSDLIVSIIAFIWAIYLFFSAIDTIVAFNLYTENNTKYLNAVFCWILSMTLTGLGILAIGLSYILFIQWRDC